MDICLLYVVSDQMLQQVLGHLESEDRNFNFDIIKIELKLLKNILEHDINETLIIYQDSLDIPILMLRSDDHKFNIIRVDLYGIPVEKGDVNPCFPSTMVFVLERRVFLTIFRTNIEGIKIKEV